MDTYEVKSLDAVLSEAQQQTLAEKLHDVMAHGYGRVSLIVERGRVTFVESATTERMEPVPFVQ